MNIESKKKKIDYWQIIIVVTAVVAIPSVAKILISNNYNLVYACIFGAIGGALGSCVYLVIKNKKTIFKIIAFVAELLIIFAGLFFSVKITSDEVVVKKEWKTISYGKVSFQYPYDFKEVDIGDAVDSKIANCKLYNDNRNDRLAMDAIFDFNGNPPKPEDSLSGAISNSLASIKATDVEWVDSKFYKDAVETKVKYKIDDIERRGYGFIYFNDKHYEIVDFLPVTKNYSDEFFNKILDNVSVNK